MKPVFVSIIVPVYNVEEYIKECFDSIVSQTYEGRLECIFVDDCGQDKSVEILSDLIDGYKGNIELSLVHHEHNRGLSAARNTGIDKANGEYLYFLDSDDSITPECISTLASHIEKHAGIDLVCGSAFDRKRRRLCLKHKNLPKYSANAIWIKKTMLQRYTIPVTAWNKLVRTELVKDNHIYFEEGLVHEDDLWNFFLAKYVRSIAFDTKNTYKYRVNPNGIMAHSNKRNRYNPIIKVMVNNLSEPCLSAELLYIMAHAESKDVESIVQPLFSKYWFTEALFHARLKMIDHSIFTLRGFYYQLIYRSLLFLTWVAN